MVKVNGTVLRNVVICVFAIGLCTGLIFQTNDVYARVSLSELQAQIQDLQDQVNELSDGIEDIESFIFRTTRFTDINDGTIRDNDTGLIWLKNANCFVTMNWLNAEAAAAALSYGTCGLKDGSAAGDWRLPTKGEWEAFMSTVYDNPALVNTVGDAKWSEGDAFTGVQSYYWSSTEYSSYHAWCAYMNYGNMYYVSKGNNYYVWPVRSGN